MKEPMVTLEKYVERGELSGQWPRKRSMKCGGQDLAIQTLSNVMVVSSP